MGADKPWGQNNTGSYKAFSAGQVTQRRQSNQANEGIQFLAKDGELTACVHTDLIEPGVLSISFVYHDDFVMDVEINTENWDHEPAAFLVYGHRGDNQWVALKDPEGVARLIDAINEALRKLGIKDRVGENIASLIRSVIADPKRYLALVPSSAYEACGLETEAPQVTKPSVRETPKEQHEGKRQEDTKAQQVVSLPDEVSEGENDRFVATRDFDYDKGTFAVVIKDREQPVKEATVIFMLFLRRFTHTGFGYLWCFCL